MAVVGIRELKNRLSQYLARVKKGEVVVITERGRTVARITKEGQEVDPARKVMSSLIEAGLVTPPRRPRHPRPRHPVNATGTPASQVIIEDRG